MSGEQKIKETTIRNKRIQILLNILILLIIITINLLQHNRINQLISSQEKASEEQYSDVIAELKYDGINVKDYGAKGDGVTDDTKSIQAAYSAANTLNKSLYIPNGDYLVSGLVFDKCINVIGESELTRFLANSDNITIIKFNNIDKTPAKSYMYTVGNFTVWANGHTNCIGVHSYRCNGYDVFNISADGCVQGFRFEADQFCQYTNVRARNCIIGLRLVDDTIAYNGGGNNNQFNSTEASVCEVGYMVGRPNAPYPLHTVTFTNAIALECSFSSYVSFNYESITFTNCSPETNMLIGTGKKSEYDGCQVVSGLGYFYNTRATFRDSIVATNDSAFTLDSNSLVTFDNFGGATCSVLCDSTSKANFINGLEPGNGTIIDAVNVDSYTVGTAKTNSFKFPNEVQFTKNITNYVNDPVKLIDSSVEDEGVTAKVDWNVNLGICGSIVITDGSSKKGLSVWLNDAPSPDGGVPVTKNDSLIVGISVVADKDCTIQLAVPGQCLSNFELVANVPERIYVTGSGGTSETLTSFDLKIMDQSEARLYFGKAMFYTTSLPNGADMISRILRDHLYNSKIPYGDVATLSSPPKIGTFKVGEVVYNKVPAVGSYLGWVCVKEGTPGTWKGFGLIEP